MSEYRLSRREAVQQMIAVAAAPFVVGCGVDRLLSPQPSVSSAASSVGPVTLIGAGDQHAWGDRSFKTGAAMRAALDAYPDAHAFALGDLVPNGTTDEYAIYHRAWGAFKDRTLFLIGNHDEKSDPQATAYYDYVGELGGPRGKGYYAKTFGPWRGYFLNSHKALEEQRDWLDQDLPNWPDHHIMAFWHIPVFATPCNMGGVPNNMGWPGLFGMGGFFQRLQNHGAEFVVSGHVHRYERFPRMLRDGTISRKGIRQFNVGTGGIKIMQPFSSTDPKVEKRCMTHGIFKLDLYQDRYKWRFTDLAGTVRDSGTQFCRKAL